MTGTAEMAEQHRRGKDHVLHARQQGEAAAAAIGDQRIGGAGVRQRGGGDYQRLDHVHPGQRQQEKRRHEAEREEHH